MMKDPEIVTVAPFSHDRVWSTATGSGRRAAALRAIALVLLRPLAGRRGEISTDDADWPAHSAIGFLLALLDELTPEDAPLTRMRADDLRLLTDDSDDANGGAARTSPRARQSAPPTAESKPAAESRFASSGRPARR